jgi:hypothetical protein
LDREAKASFPAHDEFGAFVIGFGTCGKFTQSSENVKIFSDMYLKLSLAVRRKSCFFARLLNICDFDFIIGTLIVTLGFLVAKYKINHERAAQALAPREHEIRKARNFHGLFRVFGLSCSRDKHSWPFRPPRCMKICYFCVKKSFSFPVYLGWKLRICRHYVKIPRLKQLCLGVGFTFLIDNKMALQ